MKNFSESDKSDAILISIVITIVVAIILATMMYADSNRAKIQNNIINAQLVATLLQSGYITNNTKLLNDLNLKRNPSIKDITMTTIEAVATSIDRNTSTKFKPKIECVPVTKTDIQNQVYSDLFNLYKDTKCK